MPLISKAPFVLGTVFTPEVATEMASIVFDDQPTFYGHYARIADSSLSNAPGQIKDRVAQNELNLKVTAGSGLNALYAAGTAIYGNTVFTILSGSVSLTASANNFIYVGTDGIVRVSTALPPIVRGLLAMVVTNTTGVLTVTDQREGYKVESVKPFSISVRNFGGRGDQGSFTAVGNEVLADGEYYYNNFTVPAGVTITIARLAYIYCTGAVNIAGTVIVLPASAGGSGVITKNNGLCIPGQGLGAGVNEVLPFTYSFKASPIGSGGSSGFCFGNVSGYTGVNTTAGAGGAGGGGIIIECAGTITVSGTITANGVAGSVAFLNDDGTNGFAIGGGGGGSGGSITLRSIGALIVSGTLQANAGKGGDGGVGNSRVSGESGSGGGGGIITIQSPAINTTGSVLQVNGGAVGISGGSAPALYRGFGGAGGAYGGAPGLFAGDGGAGNVGIIRTQSFTPVG